MTDKAERKQVTSELFLKRDWCATFAVKQTTCLYRFSVKRICFGRYFLSFSVYFVQLSLSQCSEQTAFTTSLVTRHRSSRGISCYLCAGVVRVGSMRFAVLEPPRTREKVPV